MTTGRLLTDISNLYEILTWMTGESVYTHQLGRFSDECGFVLLVRFPELDEAGSDLSIQKLDVLIGNESDKQVAVSVWLSGLVDCKKTYNVSPMAKGAHRKTDPVAELAEKIGADRVVVVGR